MLTNGGVMRGISSASSPDVYASSTPNRKPNLNTMSAQLESVEPKPDSSAVLFTADEAGPDAGGPTGGGVNLYKTNIDLVNDCDEQVHN